MKRQIFFIVGSSNVPKKVIYEVIQESYPNAKCYFIEKECYLKSHFRYANATGAQVEAIFVGPVPHKTFEAGKSLSMLSEVNIAKSVTPVYKCTTISGNLKITKNSIRMAVIQHWLKQKNENELWLQEFISFIKRVFPNQAVF